VTARVGVDSVEAARIWRESRDNGAPLSSRALAARTGMSQSTASRLITEIRAEDDQAAA
jgi:DNA-binding MurR/RpiR family transcriptional regulator